ncbi:TPA: ribonuclease III [candidate division CPR2 bacterium]|nr:ribonuclease III [candidate division CPR2 bacterium]HCL99922.1 ribonuclease III [candidate division CPR2 bacterium]
MIDEKLKIQKLEDRLKVSFKNKDLLLQALVHRSYLNEHSDFKIGHNERLEFLGDAVLELVVTHYLYDNYPNPEGELTNWRSALVKAENLSKVAKSLDIEDYLLLSRGEKKSVGRARDVILANAMEAIIGAIYMDQGYEVAKQFILKDIISELPTILEKELYIDPKSRFQELAQDREGITPSYKVLEEYGPDHAKEFVIGVFLGEKMLGKGKGPSKQLAQQSAAEDALKNYK